MTEQVQSWRVWRVWMHLPYFFSEIFSYREILKNLPDPPDPPGNCSVKYSEAEAYACAYKKRMQRRSCYPIVGGLVGLIDKRK